MLLAGSAVWTEKQGQVGHLEVVWGEEVLGLFCIPVPTQPTCGNATMPKALRIREGQRLRGHLCNPVSGSKAG